MPSNPFAALSATLLATSAATACAQPAPVSLPAPAASSSSASATLVYRSAFEGYRSFKDQPVQPWRDANELVGRIGGWQAYAREGPGEAAPSSRPSAASPAASAGPAASKRP